MMRTFKTLKPKSELTRQYVSYYYLDLATAPAYHNEYICYPHYNNTISLYQSHVFNDMEAQRIVSHHADQPPLQIFTPIREKILKVVQDGPVYKIGIVFEPFGINQFINDGFDVGSLKVSPDFNFFSNEHLHQLFAESNEELLVNLLDEQLEKKYQKVENPYIEKALMIFHHSEDDYSIDELAERKLGISRKHFNRLFKAYIGTNPQKYRNIARFRQLMQHKLKLSNAANYSSLSHQAHYTDQSHFIKACKQLTQLTPSQFFKEGKLIGTVDTFWNFIDHS
jgi:AraC-like DNA-binding protein